jgi:hypothetical protein
MAVTLKILSIYSNFQFKTPKLSNNIHNCIIQFKSNTKLCLNVKPNHCSIITFIILFTTFFRCSNVK